MPPQERPDQPDPPCAVFAADILADRSLSREEKVRRLVQMYVDARQREVATGEGMPNPQEQASGLRRVYQALRALGAVDRLPPTTS